MTKLFYPKLSYQIIKILFKVYNELGYGYQEKYYQRAVEKEFQYRNISYKKELNSDLSYHSKSIGKYIIDFIIEDRIILELKVANDFYKKHMNQVLGYLKARSLKLGILAIFAKDGLKYKRIVN